MKRSQGACGHAPWDLRLPEAGNQSKCLRQGPHPTGGEDARFGAGVKGLLTRGEIESTRGRAFRAVTNALQNQPERALRKRGGREFVDLAEPFLLVITHPALLNCLSVDTFVGNIYNYISGTSNSLLQAPERTLG